MIEAGDRVPAAGARAHAAGSPVGARVAAARGRLARLVPIALAVVALDQLTKALIRAWLAEGEAWPGPSGLLQISHVENSGAAFGILQGAGPLLFVTTAIGVAVALAYLLLAPPGGRLHGGALALIMGGAIGNLIDRAFRGTVTDFIDPTHYPAFNLADSSIVVGVSLLLLLSLRWERGAAPGKRS